MFSCSFAYSMARANRSRLVGYISLKTGSFELIAKLQHDVAPEQAADQLRAEPEVHYLDSRVYAHTRRRFPGTMRIDAILL